jgi:hypothetical protein
VARQLSVERELDAGEAMADQLFDNDGTRIYQYRCRAGSFFAMVLDRRNFLGLPLAIGAAALPAITDATPLVTPLAQPSLLPAEIRVLGAYVDTLLPAEGASPSALELDVQQKMADYAARHRGYLALLQQGTRWLHHMARRDTGSGFADLSPSQRTGFVRMAELAEPKSNLRRFFEISRRDAFRRFYADPRAWADLGYPGPPQPLGFLDFAQPPGSIQGSPD